MLSLRPFVEKRQSDIDSQLGLSEAFMRSYLGNTAFEAHQTLNGDLSPDKLLQKRWDVLHFTIQHPNIFIEAHLEGQLFGMKGQLRCPK